MATLNPALVTRSGARRLPRAALWLLCAAYILPGAIGRDPWRGDDIVAFGQMVAMAEGRTSWWAPALGGVPTDAALLPHWLGAISIRLLSPALDGAMAARVPFLGLLLLTLALVWYACFHLARTENAQPLPLAFGGEASAVDYARAIADGAVLALIATLGLLQLGHETTPELAQLAAVALFLYGLAAAPFRPWLSRGAVLSGLPLLAACDAPSMALGMGLGGALVCARSAYPQVRRFTWWVAAAVVAAAVVTTLAGGWHWRAERPSVPQLLSIARQWLWFMWPSWVLGLWTLWRWRRHLARRHMAVPLVTVVVALASNLAMSGLDRALLLGLPGLAVLAAFALPTLHRSTSAAIDWFSMSFFTACAIAIWVIYAAMHTLVPAKTAANIAKLAPGFVAHFSVAAFVLAGLGTLAWLWLVRWRTGRHREAVWKSMVLPAGGVVLSWWLLMTLWLPLLDYARSSRPLVERIAAVLPRDACVAAPRADPSLVVALEFHGRWSVDARPVSAGGQGACDWLVLVSGGNRPAAAPEGWQRVADLKRPTSREEVTSVFRRSGSR